jgi:tripartite-type tricarboxylate transporter receptor subunit TctC
VTQSIVEPEKVQIDFTKFAWLGAVTPDFRVCYSFGDKGPKTWAEMMSRKEFVLGSTGKGSGNYINGATLKYVFGAPVKQVLGFPGSAEQRIAIERGELDGDCGSLSSIPVDWLRDKKAHVFVRFLERKPPEMPASAAYIGEFAKTDEQRQLLTVLNSGDQIGRPYIASQQVPADRVAILRKAFDDTLTDKDFLADMAKLQQPVYPVAGQEAETIVAAMAKASPAIVKKAREVYQ